MSTLPTAAQFTAAFVAWFNKLVGRPTQNVAATAPNPGLVTAADLTLADIQSLLGISAPVVSGVLVSAMTVTQSGTADPVATMLQNDAPIATFVRTDVGQYTLTFSTAYTARKIGCYINNDRQLDNRFSEALSSGNGIVTINTFDETNTLLDGVLLQTFLQITIYP